MGQYFCIRRNTLKRNSRLPKCLDCLNVPCRCRFMYNKDLLSCRKQYVGLDLGSSWHLQDHRVQRLVCSPLHSLYMALAAENQTKPVAVWENLADSSSRQSSCPCSWSLPLTEQTHTKKRQNGLSFSQRAIEHEMTS